ncbi:GNAT family N-acetyltransferase [Vibrio sinaloensis]|uniref:GNAT family N-acetyltransferase n=1 Tax=Photobacterium sp. (strain ATCC 43367) TaxID=379097 RepID=UPI00205482DB|nr:GNAT family N-acetyltransferase [Vibrio sinaloensis]UPQ89507.1 N-acetyltransferase [Vibrio sinaloensis]
MSNTVVLDQQNSQFRVHLEDQHYATVTYVVKGDVYVITATHVPEALRGRGFGKVMMEALLAELENMQVKVEPVCSYVVHYLERHPEWAHLKA